MMDEEKRLSRKKNILFSAAAVVLLCVLLFPLYWALITSLKTEQEIFQNPPTFYPHVLNTKSYAAQVETGDFNMFRSFGNSFLISCPSIFPYTARKGFKAASFADNPSEPISPACHISSHSAKYSAYLSSHQAWVSERSPILSITVSFQHVKVRKYYNEPVDGVSLVRIFFIKVSFWCDSPSLLRLPGL